jgi:nucleotide-binding universal stress UspA family protein
MPFEDLLLHLDSYPDPTPVEAIDEAVAFAAAVGGKLTALALQVAIPLESNRVADYLIGLSSLVQTEEARCLAACRTGLDSFTKKAKAAGVFADTVLARSDLFDMPEVVARRARTRDACLVPLGGRFDGQQEIAQGAIFESGRPVLVFTGGEGRFAAGLRKVVVAWDGGRCAASALAEALPILARAEAVHIVTVVGEKPSATADLGPEVARHLATHGIAAHVEAVDAGGRKIGPALDAYLTAQDPDLMVMGAYGHSRIREFILGGATEHALWNCKVPTLLAH